MTSIIDLSHQAALLIPILLRVLAGATVILLLAAGAVLALRNNSAALKHRVWGLSTAALLALPVLTIFMPRLAPEWQLTIPNLVASANWNGNGNGTDAMAPVVVLPRSNQTPATQRAEGPVPSGASAGDGFTAVRQGGVPILNALGGDIPPDTTTALRSASFHLGGALISLWLTGAVVGLLLFARRQFLVSRIVRGAAPITDPKLVDLLELVRKSADVRVAVRLLCSPELTVPVAVGYRRPVIFLPAGYGQWSEERCRVVLSHELAHVRRQDVLWQALAQLACHTYWFHPLVWLTNYRMRVEREIACDDAVLEMGESPRHYASQLVALASALRPCARLPESAVAMAGSGSLEQRVGAILHPRRRRRPVARRTGRILAAGAVVLVVILSLTSASTSQAISAAPTSENAPAAVTPIDPPATADPLRTPIAGKGFVVVPFLTDLQRNCNWSHVDAALFLLINATDLCSDDDTTLNMSAVDFAGIEAAMLTYYRNGVDLKGKRIVIHVVAGPSRVKQENGLALGASDLLNSYLHQRRWTSKPNEVSTKARNPNQPLNWEQLVAALSKVPTEEEIRRESGIGDTLVKVYPIVTPLSRYFEGPPVNSILRNLKPCDDMTPDEVEAFPGLVKGYLARLELGERRVTPFFVDFGKSTSKGNAVAKKLREGLDKNGVHLRGIALWSAGQQHTSPILWIKLGGDDNLAIENATISATYAPERKKSVLFEREKDGRWRSQGLTGDEEFTLSIGAPGYKTESQKLNLPWDTTKNLEVTLKKSEP